MGELAESFRAFREERRESRLERFTKNIEILKNCGYEFDIKNEGEHYIYRKNGIVMNFWPSSGKFRSNDGKISGVGIDKFLRLLKGL